RSPAWRPGGLGEHLRRKSPFASRTDSRGASARGRGVSERRQLGLIGTALIPPARPAKPLIDVRPVTLEGGGVRLEPLTEDHHDVLANAAGDGRLWELWFIGVPPPEGMR